MYSIPAHILIIVIIKGVKAPRQPKIFGEDLKVALRNKPLKNRIRKPLKILYCMSLPMTPNKIPVDPHARPEEESPRRVSRI